MKREWIALGVILAILAFSIFNAKYVAHKTADFRSDLQTAQEDYIGGDRKEAASHITNSIADWLSWHKYANIMLRHSEVDEVTDSYYDLLAALEDSGQEVPAAAFDKVTQKLRNISNMEQMTLGSIL